jgi:predicted nucleotide-binding protein
MSVGQRAWRDDMDASLRWKETVDRQITKLESIRDRLALYDGPTGQPKVAIEAAIPEDRSKVFVVHGHDDGALEAVARFIQALGFHPIILHERANEGRTIIEKVEAHGAVGFAVVLLTPDDEGCVKGGGMPNPRARQNVILELGYFIGRLGRKQVCALKRGDVEIPSDSRPARASWPRRASSNGWLRSVTCSIGW